MCWEGLAIPGVRGIAASPDHVLNPQANTELLVRASKRVRKVPGELPSSQSVGGKRDLQNWGKFRGDGGSGGKEVILGRLSCRSRGTVEIKGLFSGNPFCSQDLALDLE